MHVSAEGYTLAVWVKYGKPPPSLGDMDNCPAHSTRWSPWTAASGSAVPHTPT